MTQAAKIAVVLGAGFEEFARAEVLRGYIQSILRERYGGDERGHHPEDELQTRHSISLNDAFASI